MADDAVQPQLKPKPERPRDELGRPLPSGSENRLHLPNFDAMTVEENHAAAIELFDAGNYFGAHEAWETCWAQRRETEEEEFFKGLAQLGAGYTHYLRGNAHGAVALLGRALERIGTLGSPHRGIDLDAFTRALERTVEVARRVEREGGPLPPLEAASVPRAAT